MRTKFLPAIAAGALIGLGALAPAPAALAASSTSTTAKVIRVIDGDTTYSQEVQEGGFPLACGLWAPHPADLARPVTHWIDPSGRRCARCVVATTPKEGNA